MKIGFQKDRQFIFKKTKDCMFTERKSIREGSSQEKNGTRPCGLNPALPAPAPRLRGQGEYPWEIGAENQLPITGQPAPLALAAGTLTGTGAASF